ncbi:MAG: NUDIX hydrolase [Pseudomonadota bacterium]
MSQRGQIIVGVGVVTVKKTPNDTLEVLLIRRGRPPFEGKWSIPGGKLKYGEHLEAAALRELHEETAVEARIIKQIGTFEALPSVESRVDAEHFVMVDFLAEWIRGEPCAGDDAVDAGFFSVEEAVAKVSWDKTREAVKTAVHVFKADRD